MQTNDTIRTKILLTMNDKRLRRKTMLKNYTVHFNTATGDHSKQGGHWVASKRNGEGYNRSQVSK